MDTKHATPLSIRLGGQLMDLTSPQVMGILNVTPDSFYAASRTSDAEAAVRRAHQILEQGGSIIDIGACSTRPDSAPVDEQEEWRRLDIALAAIRSSLPDAVLSVDTFRASVARRCVQNYGVQMINDISGGALDKQMFQTVADLRVPYVLTHYLPSPAPPCSADQFLADTARLLAKQLQQLHAMGVADVILDPGFGFGKTLEQNNQLMARLRDLISAFPATAFLIGISRKSMIWKSLNITPEQALNGTTVLNTLALQAGAHILRVHDVREAVEVTRLLEAVEAIA